MDIGRFFGRLGGLRAKPTTAARSRDESYVTVIAARLNAGDADLLAALTAIETARPRYAALEIRAEKERMQRDTATSVAAPARVSDAPETFGAWTVEITVYDGQRAAVLRGPMDPVFGVSYLWIEAAPTYQREAEIEAGRVAWRIARDAERFLM